MTETSLADSPAPKPQRRGFADLARWKKILIVIAGVCIVVGLALLPFERSGAHDLTTSPGGGALTTQGLPTTQGAGGQALDADGNPIAAETPTDMSPAFLKLGFSFFAAFAAGLAMRSFLRLALIFVGLQVLALVGLSQLEWVTVNWEAMSGAFDQFVAKVQKEAGSLQTLLTGSLPQAGLATLGLYAGLKR